MIAAGLAAALALGSVMLVGLVQTGLVDGPVQTTLSVKTGRHVAFGHLHASLLSSTPSFVIDDLSIGSPAEISNLAVLTAPLAVLRVHLVAALTGKPGAFDVTLSRPIAHLVRLGPGRNNYGLGLGRASTGWRRLGRLEITDGAVTFDDPQRHVTLEGRFNHRADGRDPHPFHLTGGGTINGEPYSVEAKGASLGGRDPSQPYPFDAVLRDGELRATITGSTGKPFDFRQLDVQMDAAGPNLADFTYLFQAPAPNTAPFQLTAHIRRTAPKVWITGVAGKIGDSDVRGSLSSDHPSGGRRMIQASLQSNDLYLRDLRTVLGPLPPHGQTRAKSGAARAATTGGLFSAKPFKSDLLRRSDLRLQIHAARIPDAPFPVGGLDSLLTLQSGRLLLSPATFQIGPSSAGSHGVTGKWRPDRAHPGRRFGRGCDQGHRPLDRGTGRSSGTPGLRRWRFHRRLRQIPGPGSGYRDRGGLGAGCWRR